MQLDVDGSAAATGRGGNADSSWEAQMDWQDWQEQLNEARSQGPCPSRPRSRNRKKLQSGKNRAALPSEEGKTPLQGASRSVPVPLSLSGEDGRQKACENLYKIAAGLRFTQCDWIYDVSASTTLRRTSPMTRWALFQMRSL